MATKVFPTEMADRGTVLGADKLLIWNSTTGSSEETTTVTKLTKIVDDKISASQGNLLGGIAFDATAPTPAANGRYVFTSAGSCTWITGGAVTVAVNDEVLITYTAPSTYVYTYLSVSSNFVRNSGNETIAGIKTFSSSPIIPTPTTDYQSATKKYVDDGLSDATYNVTVSVPLESGYYTPTTARAAVPVAVRKSGLVIIYETALGIWEKEQFIGSFLGAWNVSLFWSEGKQITKTIGKNLYNKLTVTSGKFINETNGELATNAAYACSDFIPVLPNTTYVQSIYPIGYSAWYDIDGVYISGTATGYPKTSPANAAFMRISLYTDYIENTQLEVGATATTFAAYAETLTFGADGMALASEFTLSIADGSLTPTKMSFIEKQSGKNKFNKTTATAERYVNWENGEIAFNATYSASDFIPVNPETLYSISGQGAVLYGAFYDTDKVFISGVYSTSYQSPALAAFARITLITSEINTTQFEEGSEITTYEAYYDVDALNGVKVNAADVVGLNKEVSFLKTNRISLPAKQYFLGGYENTIYHEAICERWLPYNYFVQIENGAFINRRSFARITDPDADASVTATLYDLDFSSVSSKVFALLVGEQSTNNGALVINAIGDSLTYNGSYLKRVKELCQSTSFVGMRVPYGDSSIKVEGRGGWSLASYFTALNSTSDSFSPFMQLTDPYKYYGNTDFWKKVVNGDTSYAYDGFSATATAIGFSALTGLKSTPATNDVMYNNDNLRYEVYNGSSWVAITLVTNDFSFNYAKYRSVWGIAQPDIVSILLGINDFNATTEATITDIFATFKTRMEMVIASILADNATAKIALCIAPSVNGGSNDTIDTNEFNARYNAAMWRARKLMIDNFDAREAESIYLVDTGSSLDPVYGFGVGSAEKPFSDYGGTETIKVQGNLPHPSTQGYYQMGIRLAGFIQATR